MERMSCRGGACLAPALVSEREAAERGARRVIAVVQSIHWMSALQRFVLARQRAYNPHPSMHEQ